MSSHYYNYSKIKDVAGDVKPENLHLAIENDGGTYIYFVDSANNKLLKKLDVSDGSVTTVETRTNKDIARIWHDRTNGYLYVVDCEYDNTTSYIWKLDMSDDSVTELDSVPADVFDIFLYSNELYIIYASASGYTLETGDIDPDGDDVTQWSSSGAQHFTEIDEGSPPNTSDLVYTNSGSKYENFTMETIDMSGYDSAGDGIDQVYQIKVYVYIDTDDPFGLHSLYVYGNKTGMSAIEIPSLSQTYEWRSVTFTGLSLTQADLNDLEIGFYTDLFPSTTYYVATMYATVYFYGDHANTYLTVKNVTTDTTYENDMGAFSSRSWDISMISIVGTDFYFLWKWSDENVELWKFATAGSTFTEMEDCGSTTEIATIQQGGIAYDDSDVLFFVLGTGTAEVSTIVADVPGNIDDGDYINYYAIELDYENERSEKAYYIWFDKVGDESGDPAPGGKTKITVDISASVTAQDVSDAIESAVDAVTIISCDNAGGTTCTLTNHYNGDVTNIADVDSGLAVATTTPGVDNTYYLYTYAITSDTLTQRGEYNIALMLNRNTDSNHDIPFNLEKAFDITLDASYRGKIYMISKARGNLYCISRITLSTSSSIVAITDQYLIADNNGDIELWEDLDFISYVDPRSVIRAKARGYWKADIWFKTTGDLGPLDILDGLFVVIIGPLTSNNVTTNNSIQMEGYARTSDIKDPRKVWLDSPAMVDLRNKTGTGSYSGRSDEIITSLLAAVANYLVPGTMSNGSAMGTIDQLGRKGLISWINYYAQGDMFIWVIQPDQGQGLLHYNDGTVDSGVDLDETDGLRNFDGKKQRQIINQVNLKGAIDPTTGVPYESVADDEASQDIYGIQPIYRTYAHLTQTLLDTQAQSILTSEQSVPFTYTFDKEIGSEGLVLPSETITLSHSKNSVSSGQRIVDSLDFYFKTKHCKWTVTDAIVYTSDIELLKQEIEENTDLVEQLMAYLQKATHPNFTPADGDHSAEGTKTTLTAGENLVFGEVCYFKSDGKMWKADADDSTKIPMIAMALESITADSTGEFLLNGTVRDDSWNWTVGGRIYLSTTAGALTQTEPTESLLVGIGTHADRMIFNPNYRTVSGEAYSSSWNSDTDPPTKDSVYDKISTIDTWTIDSTNNCIYYEHTYIMNEGFTVTNLQAVIDLVEANGGGEIRLPEGTCALGSTTVTIDSPYVKIIGAGMGATIFTSTSTTTAFEITANYTHLENFTVDISGSANIAATIRLNGAHYCIFRRLYCKGNHGDGQAFVFVTTVSNHTVIEDCIFYLYLTGILCNSNVAKYAMFVENNFLDMDNGIIINGDNNYINMSDNVFYEIDTVGVNLNGADRCTVVSNAFYNCTADVSDTGTGNEVAHNTT